MDALRPERCGAIGAERKSDDAWGATPGHSVQEVRAKPKEEEGGGGRNFCIGKATSIAFCTCGPSFTLYIGCGFSVKSCICPC